MVQLNGCYNGSGLGPGSSPEPSESCLLDPRSDSPTSLIHEGQTQGQGQVATKSNEERLLDLTNKTDYTIVQRNGQRIYGGPPPGWTGPAPERGCEVFVGKVPRDIYEDELVPIFERAGTIYELRLMMDFSGSNRGYFFVRYTSRDEARAAVRMLNNFEIRPKKHLGVIQSVDNRKLWISGIPKDRTAQDIKHEMSNLTDGVRDVILYPSQQDKSKMRGYAFVEYETHRAAALARRRLVPGRVFLFGQEIEKVDWAEPETEVDDDVMSKVRVLFVRNLMYCTTEDQIRHKFEQLAAPDNETEKVDRVERVKKNKDYAFVHFCTRDAAERALDAATSEEFFMDGSLVHVTWSKPVDKNNYNARKNLTKLLSTGAVFNTGMGMHGDGYVTGSNAVMPMYGNHLPHAHHPYHAHNGQNSMMNGQAHSQGHASYGSQFQAPPPLPPTSGFHHSPFSYYRGAPGTAPPRRLLKISSQFVQTGNGNPATGNGGEQQTGNGGYGPIGGGFPPYMGMGGTQSYGLGAGGFLPEYVATPPPFSPGYAPTYMNGFGSSASGSPPEGGSPSPPRHGGAGPAAAPGMSLVQSMMALNLNMNQ